MGLDLGVGIQGKVSSAHLLWVLSQIVTFYRKNDLFQFHMFICGVNNHENICTEATNCFARIDLVGKWNGNRTRAATSIFDNSELFEIVIMCTNENLKLSFWLSHKRPTHWLIYKKWPIATDILHSKKKNDSSGHISVLRLCTSIIQFDPKLKKITIMKYKFTNIYIFLNNSYWCLHLRWMPCIGFHSVKCQP